MYRIIGKLSYYLTVFLCFMLLLGCGMPGGKRRNVPTIEMIAENPLAIKRTDEFIVLKVDDIKSMAPDFSKNTFIVIQADTNKEVPLQLDDMNNDGEGDEIAMSIDLEPKEKKRLLVRYSPESPENRAVTLGHKKRTRSAIHPEYQGIGWESELIGYRLYPDQRNSISVLGKQKPELSLDKFALNQSSSTKVVLDGGYNVGCGGFGIWSDNRLIKPNIDTPRYTRIISDGPVRSVVQVIYDKWTLGDKNLSVTATYSIFAGQRWCSSNIKITGTNIPINVGCGLTKISSDIVKDDKKGFFHIYDKKTKLGIGLIYPNDIFDAFQENGDSYLAILNSGKENDITYWFLSAWGDADGIGVKDANEFAKLVSSTSDNINNPVTITIMPVKSESK